MCLVKCCVFVFLVLFLERYHALNCHSEGGPKVEELKSIYMTCLKRQDGKNNRNRGHSGDNNWNSGGPNQKWNKERKLGSRDDRMSGSDDGMNDRDYRTSGSGRDDRTSSRDDRDRMSDGYNRDDRMGSSKKMGSRDMMGRNEGHGRSDVTGRDDFPLNDDFGSFSDQQSPYNTYRSTTQSPRRFRRDKRTGMNSGQRSQYNPNASTRRPDDDDSYRNDNRNNNENSTLSNKEMDKKSCALHCFMENLEMIAENGMPDKYLVTHAITKDVKNEDLRDFLQESIEECFQILNNENTEDKCEFSMNLLMCLSEKGRANCDDWKDDAIQI